MWMDAFLSAAVVVVAVIASAVVAAFGVPRGMTFALGLAVIVCAVLLATFGAITGVLLMVRLRAGEYLLPAQLRLPLPAPMQPELALVRSAGTGSDPGLWSVVDRVADERAGHAVTAAAAAAEFCADDRDDLDARLA